jgi:hypothetical protein
LRFELRTGNKRGGNSVQLYPIVIIISSQSCVCVGRQCCTARFFLIPPILSTTDLLPSHPTYPHCGQSVPHTAQLLLAQLAQGRVARICPTRPGGHLQTAHGPALRCIPHTGSRYPAVRGPRRGRSQHQMKRRSTPARARGRGRREWRAAAVLCSNQLEREPVRRIGWVNEQQC